MIDPANALGILLLGVNIAALGLVGLRIVSPTIPGGLERGLAVATVVASAAVIEALGLGLFGIGSEPLVLTTCSLVLAAGARVMLSPPAAPPTRELRAWWSHRNRSERLLLGAIVGIASAWGAWVLAEPGLDIDSTLYHLPEIAIWINDGTPGSVVSTNVTFPTGSYPITHEVLLSWAGGVSRNIAPVLLAGPAALLLLLAALGGILRGLAVRPLAIGLALAVVVGLPFIFDASVRISTDLASVAWMAVAIALALHASRPGNSPNAIAFALPAFGLAVGTKTTVALLGVLVMAAISWRMRPAWAAIDRRGLAAGGLVAVAVGGVWYLRNLIEHGSPLWPFASLPWGDPRPSSLMFSDESLLANPVGTIDGRVGAYLDLLGPTPLLLAVGVVLALAARERRMILLALTVALGALAWMASPYTGVDENGIGVMFALSSVRYLMGVSVVAVVTLALLGGHRNHWIARVALGTLALAALWAAVELYPGRDAIPAKRVLVLGALAGFGAAGAIEFFRRTSGGRRAAFAGLALVAALAVIGLAAYPQRFSARYSEPPPIASGAQDARRLYAEVSAWLGAREAFTASEDPVFFYPATIGPIAGGDFSHPLELVEPGARCAGVNPGLRDRWTVIFIPAAPSFDPDAGCFASFPPLARFAVSGAGLNGEIRVVGAPSAAGFGDARTAGAPPKR